MVVENGSWTPQGPDRHHAKVLTPEELENYVNQVGFLPLFAMPGVPGFSAEEISPREYWWTGNALDPWEWRGILAGRGNVAYGKFFAGKAGFISKEWFPLFASYRRDGYDFDSRWEDGLATTRQKKIIDTLDRYGMLLSPELKGLAGFGKGGEKGYEGVISLLMMQTYIVLRGFEQRRNKKGEPYGWAVALYSSAEQLFGGDYIASGYKTAPQKAREEIERRVLTVSPAADLNAIRKMIK